ncbi:MAG: MFS transporter [Myxococcales bacterium]|nr:MFS transporter [Myxococcales bacterium]MCB9715997.1 MFS transporter [Myxococcales bacterium]
MTNASTPSGGDEDVPVAAFATLWLTLFIDLVGFGIIIPVLPFYATSFGASPQVVTLLSTSYSLAQFLAAPVLGRISDRVGRRPVMLVSIAGSAVSMLVLGLAQTLWMVFLARALAGLFTANISTAHAYVADRVAPAKRAKYMGLMGSAIGLGFVFGPAMGGLLSTPEHPELPFLVSAGLAALNWGMAFLWLPESHRRADAAPGPSAPGVAAVLGRRRPWSSIVDALWGKPLGWLVLVNLGFVVAFAAMESTYALMLEAVLGYGAQQTGAIFAFIGVIIVLTQGLLVGRLVGRLGERHTLMTGMLILSAGLVVIGLMEAPWLAFVGSAGIACGNGLMTPSINALVSRFSSGRTQGFHMGLSSSAGALGRIVGPAWAGVVFERVGPGVPMLVAAGLVVVAGLVVLTRLRAPPDVD